MLRAEGLKWSPAKEALEEDLIFDVYRIHAEL